MTSTDNLPAGTFDDSDLKKKKKFRQVVADFFRRNRSDEPVKVKDNNFRDSTRMTVDLEEIVLPEGKVWGRDTEPILYSDGFKSAIERSLGDDYSLKGIVAKGGTRLVLDLGWGKQRTQTEEERVGKIDLNKKVLDKPGQNMSRGYDTSHDIMISAVLGREAEEHGVLTLLDVKDVEIKGENYPVLIQRKISGSQTLDERVKDKPLSDKEFVSVFSGVLDAENYLVSRGVYHRDLSPFNILVTEDNKSWITDLALACRVNDAKERPLLTEGSRYITDPRTQRVFTGVEGHHDVLAEINAVGINMYHALTGIKPFEVDSFSGVYKDLQTGESLLGSDGLIDKDKQKKAIKKALKKVPRKWRSLVERCITPNMNERYESLADLTDDFNNRAGTRTGLKKFAIVAGTIFGLALGAGGVLSYGNINKKPESLEVKVEDPKTPVITDWDSEDISLGNSVFEADASGFYTENDSPDSKFNSKNDLLVIPTEKYRENGTISVTIWAREMPRNKRDIYDNIRGLRGRIYFEGFDGKDFSIYPSNYDKSNAHDDYHGRIGAESVAVSLPPLESFGKVRNLAVEVYAPRSDDNRGSERVKWDNPNTIVSRFLIPVVVGGLEDKKNERGEPVSDAVKLTKFRIFNHDGNEVEYRRVDEKSFSYTGKDIQRSMTNIVMIPEIGFEERLKNRYGNACNVHEVGIFILPETQTLGPRTLLIANYTPDGRLQNYTGIPIERAITGTNKDTQQPIYEWVINKHPTDSFYEDLKVGRMVMPRTYDETKRSSLLDEMKRLRGDINSGFESIRNIGRIEEELDKLKKESESIGK